MPTPEEEYLALMNPQHDQDADLQEGKPEALEAYFAGPEAPDQEERVRQLAGGILSNPNIQSGSTTPAEKSDLARVVESTDLTPMESDDLFEALDTLFSEKAVDAVKTITIELLKRAALAQTPEMEREAIAEIERVSAEYPADEALACLREVAEACGEALSPEDPSAAQPTTFADVLKQIDPRDSDAALAMLDWLETYGRLNQVGTLHGGQGYLYVYKEPKGTSKAGYVPGGTKGGRLVDEAVAQARASGVAPKKPGLCVHCFSAVYDLNGTIMLDDPDHITKGDGDLCQNSPDGKHEMA